MKKILFFLTFLLLCHSLTSSTYLPKQDREIQIIPPQGKTLLIIGQDKDSIENYIKETNIIPAGFMVYTSIQNMDGLYDPVDHGAGYQHAQYFVDKYPNTVIQLGLYMVNALPDIIKGKYNSNIKKLSNWIKESKRPVFLRIGYEFDGPHNKYNPKEYVKAFRYIVDRLRKYRVKNAVFVWHSFSGYTEKPFTEWYPGDEYVDWVGISYFSSLTKRTYNMLKFAKEHNKLFMIAESTPCGIGTHYPEYALQRWYKPFFEFTENHEVNAISYINTNWEEQPMWRGQGWKDARIQSNKLIKGYWLREIERNKYINSCPSLYELIRFH